MPCGIPFRPSPSSAKLGPPLAVAGVEIPVAKPSKPAFVAKNVSSLFLKSTPLSAKDWPENNVHERNNNVDNRSLPVVLITNSLREDTGYGKNRLDTTHCRVRREGR